MNAPIGSLSIPNPAGAQGQDAWTDALLAAQLFAIDPYGCGGISLRAPAGPVRDRWLACVLALLPSGTPQRRLPLGIPDSRLLGGLDLAATLRAGRPVAEEGLLAAADGGIVILPMAERCDASLASRLAATLDDGMVTVEREGFTARHAARLGLVALDEGIDDERPPSALLDRLSFHCDLADIRLGEATGPDCDAHAIAAARRRLAGVEIGDSAIEALCGAALALGIRALRPSLLAIKVARAAAALAGRRAVSAADAAVAGRLVLAPRAVSLPSIEPEPPDDAPPDDAPPHDATDNLGPADDRPSDASDGEDEPSEQSVRELEDIVLAATRAALPADLLAALMSGERQRGAAPAGGRAGALRQAPNRGRPVGVRKGDPRGGARLALVETLRAAAPWQTLRRRPADGQPQPRRIEVRRDDFRVTRFKQRAGTTTIFVVDASGSAALKRLAEAKGAVELLLADCYVRRDEVALVSFRGLRAELILPPTRSLTRARRSLAGLPGGGGTPLAGAIDVAGALAEGERRKGRTPVVVFLTDGGANIARGGAPGRARAREEAIVAARMLRGRGYAAMLVDTSPKPQPAAASIAAEMGARYLPLPYADAAGVSRAILSGRK
jgi:magnesium chelatase subunit D